MRLLLIRHGDPDYEHDTLTPNGHAEAKLLADMIAHEQLDAIFLSPLGRAQDTARYTLERIHRTGVTLDWLREFHAPIQHPDTGDFRIPWDWLPDAWTSEPMYFDKDRWCETPLMQQYEVGKEARRVAKGLDSVLCDHGYVHENGFYRAVRPNTETLAFFCHFGVGCVMLGSLLNISPMVLWHGFAAPTSSVTTLYTEERRAGVASFRVRSYGDISHLYAAGRAPSFSARFCETYTSDQRHD